MKEQFIAKMLSELFESKQDADTVTIDKKTFEHIFREFQRAIQIDTLQNDELVNKWVQEARADERAKINHEDFEKRFDKELTTREELLKARAKQIFEDIKKLMMEYNTGKININVFFDKVLRCVAWE